MKLARLFKSAEHFAEQGKLNGDQVYIGLYKQADNLITEHQGKYPDFNVDEVIPAMADLKRLTEFTPEPEIGKILAISGLISIGVVAGIGFVAAAITESTHLWIHLFHLCGL